MGKRRRKSAAEPPAPAIKESRPAEWATIGWLLASLTTAACLGLWALVRVAGLFVADSAQTLPRLAGFLLFAALVVGSANLMLCAAAHGLRATAPPRSLLWFSLAVGVAPMMMLWLV
ncbi:MAG: hypothetical protein U0836_26480 [Pirellulales bacterium]|mgnify:CR=1 FL=1